MMTLFFAILCTGQSLLASVPVSNVDPKVKSVKMLTYSKTMKVSDAEVQLGREMKFMEKFAFRLNKKKFIDAYNADAAEGKGETDGLAIAGFVVSFFVPIVGLILSAVALGKLRKNGKSGKGLATAGLILGILGTVLAIIILL
jgi:hypothetical protein